MFSMWSPHGELGCVDAPTGRAADAGSAPGTEREALLRVAAAAAGAHNLEEVLEVAAEEARAAIGAASLSVSRWEREQGALRTVINVGELGPGRGALSGRRAASAAATTATPSAWCVDGLAYFNSIDAARHRPGRRRAA